MLRGEVRNFDIPVGTIEETAEKQYIFRYNSDLAVSQAVSVTLPTTKALFEEDKLFGFFDGLIPEGWLLNLTVRQWKIDRYDRMRLLLATCADCIGSVSVHDLDLKSPLVRLEPEMESAEQQEPFATTICLRCLNPLGPADVLMHRTCSVELFGLDRVPDLPVSSAKIEELGLSVVNQRLAMTGVQRKLSLSLDRNGGQGGGRLTIVGLWGEFILKPSPSELPSMAANEHVIMNLAATIGIPVAPCALLPLKDGRLAYLVRRFDRQRLGQRRWKKIAVEDFGQLFNKNQGAQKYSGSYNAVGRWIKENSAQPGLDLSRFFELVVFSFIVGNSDLHLKNISIFSEQGIRLTPAYDLVSVESLEPGDVEELALPIGGRKNRLNRKDFFTFGVYLGIPEKVITTIIGRLCTLGVVAEPMIERSFIPNAEKARLVALMAERIARLR